MGNELISNSLHEQLEQIQRTIEDERLGVDNMNEVWHKPVREWYEALCFIFHNIPSLTDQMKLAAFQELYNATQSPELYQKALALGIGQYVKDILPSLQSEGIFSPIASNRIFLLYRSIITMSNIPESSFQIIRANPSKIGYLRHTAFRFVGDDGREWACLTYGSPNDLNDRIYLELFPMRRKRNDERIIIR